MTSFTKSPIVKQQVVAHISYNGRLRCNVKHYMSSKKMKKRVSYNDGPRREKTRLRGFANNTGADQPAHPRSLISAFIIRSLESIVCKLPTGEISIFKLVSVAEETILTPRCRKPRRQKLSRRGPYNKRRDKTSKMSVRRAKTQISLDITSVSQKSSQYAQWVAKGSNFLHADSEDTDQTELMPRLI